MGEVDLRELFRGDDPARRVREGVSDLYDRAMRNTEARERKAMLHAYTTRPTLEVRVEQVRHNPPLWRMTTCAPLMAETGVVSVDDADPQMLEAEMRIRARNELLRYGYFDAPGATLRDKQEKARQWATSMVIERVGGIVLLRDSQLHHREWNR